MREKDLIEYEVCDNRLLCFLCGLAVFPDWIAAAIGRHFANKVRRKLGRVQKFRAEKAAIRARDKEQG